jgi:putative transposase
MARLPRLVVPGQAHYLILRGHGGLAAAGICTDASDREAFTTALREAAGTEAVHLHAYAVLPAELHLLATPVKAESLGRMVQALARRYVSAYNRRHNRSGTLWDGRFRCAVVEPGPHRLAALQLVDALPAEPGASSAGHRTGGSRIAMLVDPPEVWQLGNTPFDREAGYRALLAAGLPAEQAAHMRARALGGWVIGSAAFAATLAETMSRPAAPRPRGRPRRSVG